MTIRVKVALSIRDISSKRKNTTFKKVQLNDSMCSGPHKKAIVCLARMHLTMI